jgi:glycosyltransferase involved in cell wall biosynthesis
MRVAIIGPTHPYKGGIVQHTTELAHRLTDAGHEVEIISWRNQWPFFYPGKQFTSTPELPEHAGTKKALSWRGPIGWAQWGRKLRDFDRIVFVWWVPTFQGPAYWSMLKALGRKRPPVIIVCHNVLPHKARPGDRRLTRTVLSHADEIIVHSQDQAVIANGLTARPVTVLNLPLPPLQGTARQAKRKINKELLFFGFIREYKGLDVLLHALVQAPDIRLKVAGEFWQDEDEYAALVKELGLADRVAIQAGYVEAAELGRLIQQADAVVLPYRRGTATVNVSTAHAYGTPVIATTAGTLGKLVRDGIDGLLCEPGDAESLAKAIQHFYEPGVAEKLQAGVPKIASDTDWRAYVDAIISG